MSEQNRCPCGNSAPYSQCCEPIHQSSVAARTAEQLMRARYTAFVTANLRFLLNTLHPEYRKPGDRGSLKNSFRETKWLGLSIISTERGQEQDSDGIVEFVATFVENQQIAEHHERSSFIKEHGNWYYQTALEMKAR